MGETNTASRVGVDIPYLFYDIIARIAPGAFLVVGVVLSLKDGALALKAWSFFESSKACELSVGLVTLVVGAGVLIAAGVFSFLGFLLASLSNVVVEQGMWHWWPLSIAGLARFIGAESIASLVGQFRTEFGCDFDDKSLNRASFLCSYYIWKMDPNLGAMTGRLDAELLASQSMVLVSLVLAVVAAVKGVIIGFTPYLEIWLAVLILILISASLTFEYHRKKRVYGRYAMFLALSYHPKEKAAG